MNELNDDSVIMPRAEIVLHTPEVGTFPLQQLNSTQPCFARQGGTPKQRISAASTSGAPNHLTLCPPQQP